VLRRIFGPKRDVTGGWRRLCIEELCSLYSSQSVRMIKPRWTRWVRHEARMGAMRNAYKILVAKPEHSEDLGVDGSIILK
jgi:hypothetical protein